MCKRGVFAAAGGGGATARVFVARVHYGKAADHNVGSASGNMNSMMKQRWRSCC